MSNVPDPDMPKDETISHPNPLEVSPVALPVKPKVELTEADKENFFKAFMWDKPYEEEVSLFNGEFNIVFRALTIDEQNVFFNQIKQDELHGVDVGHNIYLNTMQLYRMAMCIESINGDKFETPALTEEDQTNGVLLPKKKISLFKNWAVPKVVVINQAFINFEAKIEELSNQVLDKNFLKAGEPSS